MNNVPSSSIIAIWNEWNNIDRAVERILDEPEILDVKQYGSMIIIDVDNTMINYLMHLVQRYDDKIWFKPSIVITIDENRCDIRMEIIGQENFAYDWEENVYRADVVSAVVATYLSLNDDIYETIDIDSIDDKDIRRGIKDYENGYVDTPDNIVNVMAWIRSVFFTKPEKIDPFKFNVLKSKFLQEKGEEIASPLIELMNVYENIAMVRPKVIA